MHIGMRQKNRPFDAFHPTFHTFLHAKASFVWIFASFEAHLKKVLTFSRTKALYVWMQHGGKAVSRLLHWKPTHSDSSDAIMCGTLPFKKGRNKKSAHLIALTCSQGGLFWHPQPESNQQLIFCSRAKAETLGILGFPRKYVEIPTLLVSYSSC